MLSIIIPTLNEEKYIARTVSSLKAGLNLPHEIIITDGHSHDGTVTIAKTAGADQAVVHDGQSKQTIAAGRNAGAAVASGEFLIFIDADCTIPEINHFFDKIVHHFERDPELVAVNVAIRVEPGQETWADWMVYNLFNDYLWFVNNILHYGMAAGEFQMIRRSAFEKLHGYNPTLVAAEDIDLFARLSKIGRVRYEKGLKVYHSGRRAHKVGWPKLLSLWFLNAVSMNLRGKAWSQSWGGDVTTSS